MPELIGEKELTKILHELGTQMNSDTALREDLEVWGIDAEAFVEMVNEFAVNHLIDVVRNHTPLKEARLLALMMFQVGYKCAMEVEMRRMVERA